jgi:hypothetical protein
MVEIKLCGLLARGVPGNSQFLPQGHLAGIQPLEGKVERHQLGQRGGVAKAVGIVRFKHLSRMGVHQD